MLFIGTMHATLITLDWKLLLVRVV